MQSVFIDLLLVCALMLTLSQLKALVLAMQDQKSGVKSSEQKLTTTSIPHVLTGELKKFTNLCIVVHRPPCLLSSHSHLSLNQLSVGPLKLTVPLKMFQFICIVDSNCNSIKLMFAFLLLVLVFLHLLHFFSKL